MENTYDIETYIDKLEGELVRVCRECGFPVTSALRSNSRVSATNLKNYNRYQATSELLSTYDVRHRRLTLKSDVMDEFLL